MEMTGPNCEVASSQASLGTLLAIKQRLRELHQLLLDPPKVGMRTCACRLAQIESGKRGSWGCIADCMNGTPRALEGWEEVKMLLSPRWNPLRIIGEDNC